MTLPYLLLLLVHSRKCFRCALTLQLKGTCHSTCHSILSWYAFIYISRKCFRCALTLQLKGTCHSILSWYAFVYIIIEDVVEFCGVQLTYVDTVVHLGHTLSYNPSDSEDTYALLTVCSSTNQRAITLFALLLSQSVSYYTFALFTCTRNTLFGIYCTVVNGA